MRDLDKENKNLKKKIDDYDSNCNEAIAKIEEENKRNCDEKIRTDRKNTIRIKSPFTSKNNKSKGNKSKGNKSKGNKSKGKQTSKSKSKSKSKKDPRTRTKKRANIWNLKKLETVVSRTRKRMKLKKDKRFRRASPLIRVNLF